MPETRLLLEHSQDPAFRTLQGYESKSGYAALKKAAKMERQAIIDEIKASGLRGRGGAGFPTWIKWNGIEKDKKQPHYLICNADEGEPGTFKDKELMENTPFLLIEGQLSRPRLMRVTFISVVNSWMRRSHCAMRLTKPMRRGSWAKIFLARGLILICTSISVRAAMNAAKKAP